MKMAILAGCIGLLLSATQGSAQKVSYDFDTRADFSRYGTYAWTSGVPAGDELNHERIVAAIDEQLAARGLRPVASGGKADVLVAYLADVDRDVRLVATGTAMGARRFGAGWSETGRVEQLLNGTLAVEMIDTGTEAVVWRAIARREIDVDASPEKRSKNIRKTAEKLFRSYPVKK